MLFFTDYGNVAKVERCNMDGTNRTRIVDYKIEQPTAVTLDLVKKLVYWADAYLDYIEVVDYNGKNRLTIIHGTQVSVTAITFLQLTTSCGTDLCDSAITLTSSGTDMCDSDITLTSCGTYLCDSDITLTSCGTYLCDSAITLTISGFVPGLGRFRHITLISSIASQCSLSSAETHCFRLVILYVNVLYTRNVSICHFI